MMPVSSKSRKMQAWVAKWQHDPIVRQWIRDNPPPVGWAGTPTEWAYLEMPVGIVSKRPGFLLVLLVAVAFAASGCGDAPEVRAFDREYDWSKPAGRTAVLGIQVTFPSWLAAGDQEAVLRTVESYAQGIIAKYPKAGAFWWGNLRVYLHEAVSEKIVCYYPAIWCWGWQLGKRVYTPWRPLFDADKGVVGVHPDDTFMVVPHEVFHLIGGWEVGAASVGNEWIEANSAAQEAISYSRSHAERLELSQESVRGALARLPYVPWIEPGK